MANMVEKEDKGYSPLASGWAAVWAEENTRASIFDAMQRKETYATTGSRMIVRFFGGWNYADNLVEKDNFVEKAYKEGVPMGQDLPKKPSRAKAPTFAVWALKDPTSGNLDRVQIIKGWVDDAGQFHQVVHDIIGDAENGADVDPLTCEARGAGASALCGVWQDPDFDSNQDAVYYARVVENPSCRWSARLGLSLPEVERPDACTTDPLPRTIQERAWTSPIWYVTE